VPAGGVVAARAIVVRNDRGKRHHHAGADQGLELQRIAAHRDGGQRVGADVAGHHRVGERDPGIGEVVDDQRRAQRQDRRQVAATCLGFCRGRGGCSVHGSWCRWSKPTEAPVDPAGRAVS
jgi:hypothetical protein